MPTLTGQTEKDIFNPTVIFQGTRTAEEKDKGIALVGMEQEQT